MVRAFWCFCVNTEQHSVICRFVTLSSGMGEKGFLVTFWFSSLFFVCHSTNHFGTQFNEVFSCFYLQQFIIALDHGNVFSSLVVLFICRETKEVHIDDYKEDGKMLTFNWICVVYQIESNIPKSTEFCCAMDPAIILSFDIGRLLCTNIVYYWRFEGFFLLFRVSNFTWIPFWMSKAHECHQCRQNALRVLDVYKAFRENVVCIVTHQLSLLT